MNREGQVWTFSWADAPFVVVETRGSELTAHRILWLDDGSLRWERERTEWEIVGSLRRIA